MRYVPPFVVPVPGPLSRPKRRQLTRDCFVLFCVACDARPLAISCDVTKTFREAFRRTGARSLLLCVFASQTGTLKARFISMAHLWTFESLMGHYFVFCAFSFRMSCRALLRLCCSYVSVLSPRGIHPHPSRHLSACYELAQLRCDCVPLSAGGTRPWRFPCCSKQILRSLWKEE